MPAGRTTRVFMPKAPKLPTLDLADPATRVLRSGKCHFAGDRVRSDAKDAAAAVNVDDHDRRNQQQGGKDAPKPELPPPNKSFGIVYSRKHRRRKHPAAEVPAEEETRRFGTVYARRKGKRPKVSSPFQQSELDDLAAAIPSCSSREFAARTGFLDAHFSDLVDYTATRAGSVTLVILVDTSCSGSTHTLLRFLLPVLRWMRRSCHQGKIRKLATIVSSVGVAAAFASLGVHFIKLPRRRASALLHLALVHCGLCVLHSANKYGSLLSVNFSALPSYFQSLHSMVAFESLYRSTVIQSRRQRVVISEEIDPHTPSDVDPESQSIGIAKPTSHLGSKEPCRVVQDSLPLEETYPHTPLDVDPEPQSIEVAKPTPYVGSEEPCGVVQDYFPLEKVAGVVVHGLRLNKHQRKRRSMRRPRNRQHLTARLPGNADGGMKQRACIIQTEAELPSTKQEPAVEPVQPKSTLEISLDLLEYLYESDVSTPVGSARKHKRSSFRSPVQRMNEQLTLAEIRQNIGSTHCKANLLIHQAEGGLQEEGAEVMLEVSDTNEWNIVVKIQGVTRHSLKPSDPRLIGINHCTHAYTWPVDDNCRLEFTDKWDWLLFREFHNVALGRNSLGKTIPTPGVHDVSDIMEGILTDPFSRPVQNYIRMGDDAVARALLMDSLYDMDSEDELWLSEFNHRDFVNDSSEQKHISYEDFEKIITTFEKDAYNNPDRTNDVDQFLSRNPSVGNNGTIPAVYEYWTSKVSKRGAPLIRTFQGAPLRREQLSPKSAMKRKRSLKRQKSKAGRGKPVGLLQEHAEDEAALRRVAQAERAAKKASEKAVALRRRAQFLMANADLATYRSVMALRIAEAARRSDSTRDLVSTIHD